MRTILLFGLTLIAECINIEHTDAVTDNAPVTLIIIMVVAMVGDIISFIKTLKDIN